MKKTDKQLVKDARDIMQKQLNDSTAYNYMAHHIIDAMKSFLNESLSCDKHELVFIRNIYGDEINAISPVNKTYRSEWKCSKCGKIKYKEELHKKDQ